MQNLKHSLFASGLAAAIAITFTTGCETKKTNDGRSAGRVKDDRNITSSVQRQLEQEPVYKFETVDVRTFDGVVQLSGFALTPEQKQRASEIAQRVPGVAQVINNITLRQQVAPTGRPPVFEAPQPPAIPPPQNNTAPPATPPPGNP